MRGETVIVRAFGGKPLIKKVWSLGARVIYLIDAEELEKLLAGREALSPIGFPKEDVFRYDPELARDLEGVVWSELSNWTP
jgi:hypothetical protein